MREKFLMTHHVVPPDLVCPTWSDAETDANKMSDVLQQVTKRRRRAGWENEMMSSPRGVEARHRCSNVHTNISLKRLKCCLATPTAVSQTDLDSLAREKKILILNPPVKYVRYESYRRSLDESASRPGGDVSPSTHSYLEQLRVAGSVIRRTLPCPVRPVSYQAAARRGRTEKLTGWSQKAENKQLARRRAGERVAHRYRPSYRKLMCLHLNQMANHMKPRSAD